MLIDALESVERGECKRLMVFMPPRHGKSLISSRLFPAWYVGRNPEKEIIAASYNSELAGDFGRQVRNLVGSEEFTAVFSDVTLAQDSQAANRWHTNCGGSYVAAGVGSAITGRGAHVALIDDPIKDRQDAESETVRRHLWDWYTSTFYTRLMPDGSIVLVQTRWHQGDLAGKLLDEMELGGDQWKIISFPALDDDGNALWPEWFDVNTLDRIKSAIGSRDWEALYQQRPSPPGGGMFKREWFEIMDAAPIDIAAKCRAWDLAATSGGGDYLVGTLMSRTMGGIYCIEHVVRGQWGAGEIENIVKQTTKGDGSRVRIRGEQEPGASGKIVAQNWIKLLAGYDVRFEPSTGQKETRWRPFCAQCEAGNVKLVRGEWNTAWLDEMAMVPMATHDDQADSASCAFNDLALGFYRPPGDYGIS